MLFGEWPAASHSSRRKSFRPTFYDLGLVFLLPRLALLCAQRCNACFLASNCSCCSIPPASRCFCIGATERSRLNWALISHRIASRASASCPRSVIIVNIGDPLSPCNFLVFSDVRGRTWPAPLRMKRPAGARLLQQRRPCGRSSWQPRKFQPLECPQPLSPGSSSLRDRFRGCKLPRSLLCPKS